MKRIHFVCTGNVFRSRLAEAYCTRYIEEKRVDLKISSSGVLAEKNIPGPIAWYTNRISFHEDLIQFMKVSWDQTTAQMLESADLIVFMEEYHFNWCQDHLGYKKENYEIWNIPDTFGTESPSSAILAIPDLTHQQKIDLGVIQKTDETYDLLKQKCQRLILPLPRDRNQI